MSTRHDAEVNNDDLVNAFCADVCCLVDVQAGAESALHSADGDEGLCGTRAIVANSPEPENMRGNGVEEDCMWEEQEAEEEDDDDVQLISETGPGMYLHQPECAVQQVSAAC